MTIPDTARPRKRLFSSDRVLTLSGFALAAAAAFFPWYVFLNGSTFGVQNTRLRMDGHRSGASDFGIGGLPGALDTAAKTDAATGGFDPVITASVPQEDEKPDSGVDTIAQPFPGRPFRLLHVSNGRALIEDDQGMYLVQIGGPLPDRSTLEKLEKRDGEWVLITSTGSVLTP